MKSFFLSSCFLFLVLGIPACRLQSPYPEAPGTLFIRQQICDIDDFKKSFFLPQNDLKGHGFQAYSFLRDTEDPKTYILAFSCADLRKGVAFVQSSNFIAACVGAGTGMPLMWAGAPWGDRPDPNLAQKTGGMVVTRYEVKNFGAWKKSWDAPKGPGRPGCGSSLYHLKENPGVVIETREIPDVTQAPDLRESQADKDALNAAGVTHRDLWFGTHLEDGTF